MSTKETAMVSSMEALKLSNMVRNQFDDETSVQVFITYEQLFGKKKLIGEIEREMQTINGIDLIHFATRLGLTLQCDNGAHNFNYQIEIARQFLPQNIFYKYSTLQLMRHAIAKSKNKTFAVAPLITPIHVLNFLKHIIFSHSFDSKVYTRIEGSVENASKAFELLLAYADYLDGCAKLSPDFNTESQQAIQELIRSTLILQNEPYTQTIGRYYRMCMDISDNVQRNTSLPSLKQLFMNSTKIPYEDYFAAGLALVNNFGRASIFTQNAEDNLDNSARLHWDKYFEHTSWTKESAHAIQTSYCATLNECKQILTTLQSDGEDGHKKHSFEYDLLPFKKNPLVRVEQDIVPIHFPFLIEKFTSSIYWACFDQLTQEERGSFNDYWGAITQNYVEQIFKNTIVPKSRIRTTDIFIDVPYKLKKQPVRATDIIIFDKRFSELVFFEVTYSDLREETGSLSNNLKPLSEGMEKILAKAKQLDRVIKNIKDGNLQLNGLDHSKIKTFRPLVVTLHPFPVWNFLWHSYEGVSEGFYQRLDKANLLKGDDVTELRIISISEIETLAALQNGRIDFLSVLRAWTKSHRWSHEPLKNFLVANYPNKGNYEFLDHNYRRAVEFSSSRLFSK